jgi:hypothetical protein
MRGLEHVHPTSERLLMQRCGRSACALWASGGARPNLGSKGLSPFRLMAEDSGEVLDYDCSGLYGCVTRGKFVMPMHPACVSAPPQVQM